MPRRTVVEKSEEGTGDGGWATLAETTLGAAFDELRESGLLDVAGDQPSAEAPVHERQFPVAPDE